jgi:branched-chain amino acid aminotransferase
MNPISVNRITPDGNLPLTIQTNTLDELTHQLPQGLYTTFRTYGGCRRVLGLKAHLERLYQPVINPVISKAALRQQIKTILHDHQSEVRVRLVIAKNGDIYLALSILTPLPPEIYQLGVKVITSDVTRESPRLKSTAFIDASKNTRAQISQSNIFEALLMRKNTILEGMTSNFFYLKDGMLGTARNNILLGVTRRTVLRIARGSGIRIVYGSLKRRQVSVLSEAFLTSSSRGIVPIVQIDATTVGEGMPGPITKDLMAAYKEYVMQHAEII